MTDPVRNTLPDNILPAGIWDHPRPLDSKVYDEFVQSWFADNEQVRAFYQDQFEDGNETDTLRALAYTCNTRGTNTKFGTLVDGQILAEEDDGWWWGNTHGFSTNEDLWGQTFVIVNQPSINFPPSEDLPLAVDITDTDQTAFNPSNVGNELVLKAQDMGYHPFHAFFLFSEVEVPNSAKINYAYIQLIAKETPVDPGQTVIALIGAADSSNVLEPISDVGEATQLVNNGLTNSRKEWSVLNTDWTAGQSYDTSNIACVIQSVVDKPGWVSGNNIEIVFLARTTPGNTTIEARDYGDGEPPILYVYYTQDFNNPMSGGVKVNGTATFKYDLVMTSGIRANGTVTPTYRYNQVIRGGLKADGNGNAASTCRYDLAMSGGLKANGVATLLLKYNPTTTNGLKASGSPWHQTVFNPNIAFGTRMEGWLRRKKITIQTTYLDANLTSFPLYVKITNDTDIGASCQISGNDIRFTSSNGTLLPYEKETFSVSLGQATGAFWVKTDVATTGTEIYIYWNNVLAADASTPNTWDDNFVSVWHMTNATDTTIADSAGNNLGTKYAANQPTETDGKFHKAQDFPGAISNQITIPTANFDSLGAMTLSCWINTDDIATDWTRVIHKADTTGVTKGFLLAWSQTDGKICGVYQANYITTEYRARTSSTITTGNWYYVTMAYDGASTVTMYLNGLPNSEACPAPDSGFSAGGGNNFDFGRRAGSDSAYYNGRLDEVRVSNLSRSAAWIKFEFYNANETDNELIWGITENNRSGVISDGQPQQTSRSNIAMYGGVAADGRSIITFHDTFEVTGSAKLNGIVTPGLKYNVQMSGSTKLNGISPVTATYSIPTSGGVRANGLAPNEKRGTFDEYMSGGMKANGVVTPTTYNNLTLSGGAKTSGLARVTEVDYVSMAKGVLLSGTAHVSENGIINEVMSGGIRANGTATVTNHFNNQTILSGIRLNGNAVNTERYLVRPSGGAKITGAAHVSENGIMDETMSGGIKANSSATPIIYYAIIASGGMRANGTVPPSNVQSEHMSGSVKLSGEARSYVRYNFRAQGGMRANGRFDNSAIYGTGSSVISGGIQLSGLSPVSGNASSEDIFGSILINGQATTKTILTASLTGGMRLGGEAILTQHYANTVFGGIITSGSPVLTSRYDTVIRGGIKLGGSTNLGRTYHEIGTGGASLNGSPYYFQSHRVSLTGGITLDGTTTVQFIDCEPPLDEINRGGAVCRGMADITSTGVIEETMTGGFLANGTGKVWAIYTIDTALGVWLDGWLHRKSIRPHSIPSTLTEFPLFVRFEDSDIGAVAQADGYDIRFTASDGVTVLKHELESFYIGDDGRAFGEFWVKTDLEPNNTEIYIYYGSQGITNASSAATWNDDFAGVWHLSSNGDIDPDSTINGHNGRTLIGPLRKGIAYNGRYYDGVIGYYTAIEITDKLNPRLSDFTYNCWVYVDNDLDTDDCPVWSGANSPDVAGYNLSLGTGPWYARIGDGTNSIESMIAVKSDRGQWIQLSVVIDRTAGQMRTYYNSSPISIASLAGIGSIASTECLSFGAMNWRGGRFNRFCGTLDEVRVSNVARSHDWLWYEFHNLSWLDNGLLWGTQECPHIGALTGGDPTLSSGFTEIPEGGIVLGGMPFVTEYDQAIVDGGIVLSGTSDDYTLHPMTVDGGGLIAAGSAEVLWAAGGLPTGGMVLSGTADVSLYDIAEVVGGCTLGGTSRYGRTLSESGSGGCKVDGLSRIRTYFTDNDTMTTYGGVKAPSYLQDVPWLSGWKYRKEITVQTAYLDANLTDFPLYIHINHDEDLAIFGGDNYGYDIRFTSDDGLTILPSQREGYTNFGSYVDGYFWVKTSLSTSGTSIYMYYNNPDAVEDASDDNATWNANYKAVWHMADYTDSAVLDSTQHNNDGTKLNTNEPYQNSGAVNTAQFFDGSNDKISLDSSVSLELTSAGTLEAWVKLDAGATGGRAIINKATHWGAYANISYILYFVNKAPTLYISNGTGADVCTGDIIADTNWHHLVGTWGSDGKLFLYVDGVENHQVPQTRNAQIQSSHPVWLGHGSPDLSSVMLGGIDEARISDTARSPEWIKFEYRNMAEADNELDWGYQEAITYNPTIYYNPEATGGGMLDGAGQQFNRFSLDVFGGVLVDSISPVLRISSPVLSGGILADGLASMFRLSQFNMNNGVTLNGQAHDIVTKVMFGGIRTNGAAYSTHMGERYWVGTGANTNWNNTANWSTTSGGTPGASIPTSELNVHFDANGLGNCTLNVNAYANTIDMTTGYTGTFSGSSYNLNITSTSQFFGNVINMGSGTWTVGGSISWQNATTWNPQTATLNVTNNAQIIGSGTLGNNHLYNLVVANGANVTTSTLVSNLYIDHAADIYGTITLDETLWFSANAQMRLYATGDVEQGTSGNRDIIFWENSIGLTTFQNGAVLNVNLALNDGPIIVPGTYGKIVDFTYHGTNTLLSGFYVFEDLRFSTTDGDKTINVNASTIQVNTLLALASAGGEGGKPLTINNCSDWNLYGNVTTNPLGVITWEPNNLRVSALGTGTQTFDFKDLTIDNLFLNKTGGSLQLTSGVHPESFEAYRGLIDFNGQKLETVHDFTFRSLADIHNPGLPGSNIVVGGNAQWIGTPSQILDLDSVSDWLFTVSGSAVAFYVQVSHSDASNGSTVHAYYSYDHLDTHNWIFAYIYEGVCEGGGIRTGGGAVGATGHAYKTADCYGQFHCRIPGQDEFCILNLKYRNYGSYVFHRYKGLEAQEVRGTNIDEITSECSVALVAPIIFCRQFNDLKVVQEERIDMEQEQELGLHVLAIPEPEPEPVLSMTALPLFTVTPQTKTAKMQPKTIMRPNTPQMAQLQKAARPKTITYSSRSKVEPLAPSKHKPKTGKPKTKPTGQAL